MNGPLGYSVIFPLDLLSKVDGRVTAASGGHGKAGKGREVRGLKSSLSGLKFVCAYHKMCAVTPFS